MSPEALDVLDNAIKILGPALITGVVAYLTAKVQITSHLKELDKNNEFKARECFFNYQRERQLAADKGARDALSAIGNLRAHYQSELSDEQFALLSMIWKQLLAGGGTCRQAMQMRGLTDKKQYNDLVAAYQIVSERLLNDKGEVTQQDLSNLWELARLLDLCTDLVADHDLRAWFGKYLS